MTARLVGLLFALLAAALHAEPPRFVDTQAQFDPKATNYRSVLDTMLAEMDRVGIARTLIVPPPMVRTDNYDAEEIAKAIQGREARFGFLAGGGSLNVMIQDTSPAKVSERARAKFRARCEEILAAGALGFGEVTAEHLSLPGMGDQHPYESVPADHPLLLLLADIAAEKDVPIDIHFDVAPAPTPVPDRLRGSGRNPAAIGENLAAFERLLAHNRRARITWAHLGSDPLGQRSPQLMRELLTRHPNLYAAFRIIRTGPVPGLPLNENGTLKPHWRKLIEDFPDRFTVHSDIFYLPTWPPARGPRESHELARKLLAQLPEDLARRLAYENARKIYRLPE